MPSAVLHCTYCTVTVSLGRPHNDMPARRGRGHPSRQYRPCYSHAGFFRRVLLVPWGKGAFLRHNAVYYTTASPPVSTVAAVAPCLVAPVPQVLRVDATGGWGVRAGPSLGAVDPGVTGEQRSSTEGR